MRNGRKKRGTREDSKPPPPPPFLIHPSSRILLFFLYILSVCLYFSFPPGFATHTLESFRDLAVKAHVCIYIYIFMYWLTFSPLSIFAIHNMPSCPLARYFYTPYFYSVRIFYLHLCIHKPKNRVPVRRIFPGIT